MKFDNKADEGFREVLIGSTKFENEISSFPVFFSQLQIQKCARLFPEISYQNVHQEIFRHKFVLSVNVSVVRKANTF